MRYVVHKYVYQLDHFILGDLVAADKIGEMAVLEPSSDLLGRAKPTLDIYFTITELANYLCVLEEFRTHYPDEFAKNKELLVGLASNVKQQLHQYTSGATPFDMRAEKSDVMGNEPTDIKFVHFTSFIVSNIFKPAIQKYDDIIQANSKACFLFISPYWSRSYETDVDTPLDAKQKSKLIIDAIKKVINVNSYEDCYLWVDSECLQASDSLATTLATVYHAINKCDVVITPVEAVGAVDAPDWCTDILSNDYFPCDNWNGNTTLYRLYFTVSHSLF